MPKPTLIDVRFTVAEAKAVAFLLRAGLGEIATDRSPLSNEKTVARATRRAAAGFQKIEMALASAGTTLLPADA